jgi:hypothetical protein
VRRGLAGGYRAWLTAAFALILAVTLSPHPASPEPQFGCVICGERGSADVLLNIVLFVPLGIGLRLAAQSIGRSLLLGALLSCLVEVTQLLLPGRDPSIGDALFNTVGTATGWAVAATMRWWLDPPTRAAARLSLAAAILASTVLLLTGALLAPSPPRSTYWGQWTANLGHLEWYRGRVLEATVGSLAIPSHRLPDSEAVRQLLLDGQPIAVRALAGPPVPGLAPLLSIYDEDQREVFLLGADQTDLVFRYRTRAAVLRLDQPDLRLRKAMNTLAPGDTVQVGVEPTKAGIFLTLNAERRCGVGFTMGRGWGILLYPESLPAWLKTLLDMVWLAALALPVGFWGRVRWESAAGVLGLIAAAAVAPVLTTLVAAPLVTVVGLASGCILGVLLRRRARRLLQRAGESS